MVAVDPSVPEEGDRDRSDRAAQARIEELTRRVTHHQNEHVKLRAQLTLDIDRARWEADQADFKLAELQASLEGFLQALRDRIKSRLDTAEQLRLDTEQQLSSAAKGDLRSLLTAHSHDERHALQKRTDGVSTLKAMAEQLVNHADVQIASLQHDLADQGRHDPLHRLQAAKQALVSSARQERDSLEAIATMMGDFASQAQGQLAELKAEREHFEKRFIARAQEIARIDSRRNPKMAAEASQQMESPSARPAVPRPQASFVGLSTGTSRQSTGLGLAAATDVPSERGEL